MRDEIYRLIDAQDYQCSRRPKESGCQSQALQSGEGKEVKIQIMKILHAGSYLLPRMLIGTTFLCASILTVSAFVAALIGIAELAVFLWNFVISGFDFVMARHMTNDSTSPELPDYHLAEISAGLFFGGLFGLFGFAKAMRFDNPFDLDNW